MKNGFILIFCCMAINASAQTKLDLEAHRGGRGLMPENSIQAMLHAIDLGAKTLEFDCVISKDNQIVVSHDTYMSADFMLKSDGSAISKSEEKNLLIYKMPYDSVKLYDGGSKPHAQFPDQQKMKTYKPLLTELIDSVEHHVKIKKLKPVYYNLEIKSMPAGDEIEHPVPAVFVKLIMDILDKKKINRRVIIQSFDVRPLQELHQKYPKQKLAYLFANKESLADNLKKLGFTPQIVSPYFAMINADFVKQAHQQNVQVVPWTVNDEATMKAMNNLGVNGIISDFPDKLVRIFGSYQQK